MKTKRPDVTIVSRSDTGWHVAEVVRGLKRRGMSHAVIDFDASQNLSNEMKKLGTLTLWRGSSLNSVSQRSSVAAYLDTTYMVNEGVFMKPAVTEKYYQQQTLAANRTLSKYAIPTYMAKDKAVFTAVIKRGDLQFPVIAKPNNGSRGEGIHLLKSIDDLQKLEQPLKEYVLQNFMTNDGDWRIIVIGGRPLGVMKRIAQEGSFLNNISRGAHSINETDETIRKELFAIAPKVAALFRLRFCGVDIIRDNETGQLKVLEVNTVPQWNGEFGFQSMTGVNIGDYFAEYAESVLSSGRLSERVDAYYKKTITTYPVEQFHYASRLWLWKGDPWARQVLDGKKNWYIGDTPEETRAILARIVSKKKEPLSVNQNKKYRKEYFEKYRLLPVYNALLFKVIFSDSIYSYDIRPYVRELVSDADFLKLFGEIIADRDAIRVLSTHAINFFYLLKNYFASSLSLSASVLVDTDEILELAGTYDDLIERQILTKNDALKLQIYLLTHAVIGESKFYQKKVSLQGFKDMCQAIEDIIKKNYSDISLDNKFEFLVCTDICGFQTTLRTMILQEAKKSISWAGVFIVEQDAEAVRHTINTAEHRNVLYVMASHKRYSQKKIKSSKHTTNPTVQRKTIGRLARVRIPTISNHRFIARVDTGATSSSLCVSDVIEENGVLSYALMYPGHPQYTGKRITTKDFTRKSVKSVGTKADNRYSVSLEVVIGDNESIVAEYTLADRQHMIYPVLIGRNILRGNYKVDVDKQFATRQGKK